MNWEVVPFENVYHEPSRNGVYKPKEFRGSGTKMINMGELFTNDFVGSQEMDRILLTEKELTRSAVAEDDLLFGRRSLVEAGAGKCSIVRSLTEPTTFESSIIRVRLDKKKTYPLFYFYWFKSHAGRGTIRAIVTGTNVKGIRASNLRRVQVPSISLEKQKAIADAVSIYDELIENNKHRIKLLEESARQLYKEWFVRFRFPGHEHVKIIDGVPEGWVVTTFGQVAQAVGGGTPSTKVSQYWDDGEITWFVPKDLTQNICLVLLDSQKKIAELGLQKSSAKLLPPETILMSSRASIGYFGLFEGECCTNQGFISVIPKHPKARMYLLHNLMSRKDEIIGLAGGTTYKEINKTTFRRIGIRLPPDHLLTEFEEFAYNIVKEVRVLKKQICVSERARDLLLPKLMNGELVV